MLQEAHPGKAVFKHNPESTDNKTKNCVMRLQQICRSFCIEKKNKQQGEETMAK